MRVSIMIRIGSAAGSGGSNLDSGLMDRIVDFGRRAEASGFPGIWIGDSLGRGRPTLDSLQVLTALAAVTQRVELASACCSSRCATRSSSPIACNRFRPWRTAA
jgi:alkanesulfonate monooxygenase SsuD/methylene tetrahydromethanopterin reductase-like flavin-dependent oxidoreductase (luciferase family)